MTAEHTLAVNLPHQATTATVRELLTYVDSHAPATATLTADGGKLVASWTGDPAESPTRNTAVSIGFGPATAAPAEADAYRRLPGRDTRPYPVTT